VLFSCGDGFIRRQSGSEAQAILVVFDLFGAMLRRTVCIVCLPVSPIILVHKHGEVREWTAATAVWLCAPRSRMPPGPSRRRYG